MASPPVTVEAFFELVRRSEVVAPARLDAYLAQHRATECGPADARAAAQVAVREGLLTKYQAEELLGGRWRNFLVSGKYLIFERIGLTGLRRSSTITSYKTAETSGRIGATG
jgi:hypothetical protein